MDGDVWMVAMMAPEIERVWGARLITPQDLQPGGALYQIGIRWIARRASQICAEYLGGRPTRSALDQACNESGLQISEEVRRRIWAANQKELDTSQGKCPIVVVSDREYREEIERARVRGDIMIGRF